MENYRFYAHASCISVVVFINLFIVSRGRPSISESNEEKAIHALFHYEVLESFKGTSA